MRVESSTTENSANTRSVTPADGVACRWQSSASLCILRRLQAHYSRGVAPYSRTRATSGWHPFTLRSSTRCLPFLANCKGVSPSLSVTSTSAPCSRRTRQISEWFALAALCKAVRPSLSRVLH
ncbi:hypothetical protein PENSPDRAFT_229446 [Peniophora sp. CONT]|nr:hypothetical protein PENSPDRAFT_229446 [Peniophora sp. CONT]